MRSAVWCVWGAAVAACLAACGGCGPGLDGMPPTPPAAMPPEIAGPEAAIVAELRALAADVRIEKTQLGTTIVSIDLGLVRNSSAALRLAARLPSIDRLDLHGAELRREDYEVLGTIRTLRYVDLSNTATHDAELACLESLPNLEFLLLWSTPITDASLPRIVRLKRLQKLDLSNTKVTGGGLAALHELRDLQEVHVEIAGLPAADVERLQRKLPNTLIVH